MSARVLVLGLLLIALTQSGLALPDWIWVEKPRETRGIALHHSFILPPTVKSARLRLVTDFALVRLTINGQAAGIAEPYGPVVELDARPFLRAGRNKILLIGQQTAPAAAVALQLIVENAEGK